MARRLVIAFLLAALAAAAFIWNRHHRTVELREQRAEARLLQFDVRDVTAIDLGLGGTMHRFESGGDGWWLVSPFRDRAAADVVAQFLSDVQRSPVTRTIERPDDLAGYGLQPARLDVRLEGVQVPRLRVGDQVTTLDGVFATVEGRPGVLVVQTFPGGLLSRPNIDRFREQELVGLALNAVDSIRLTAEGEAVWLSKESDGWWIVEPRRLPAADRSVSRLLDAFDQVAIQRFVDGADPSDPDFGLSNGAEAVEFGAGEDRRTVSLGATKRGGTRYVRRADRDPVLVVDGEPLDGLAWSVDDLLDRRLTKANRYRVRSVVYTRGEEVLALVRGDDGWKTRDDGRPVSDETVYPLLQKLLETPVRGWEPFESPGGRPMAILEFEVEGGAADRARYLDGGRVVLDSVPGVAFRTDNDLPAVP